MKAEDVTVGTRWKWREGMARAPFTIVRTVYPGLVAVQYDDDHDSEPFRHSCKRIAEACERLDVPRAVAVGDVVRDPALLAVGMWVQPTTYGGSWTWNQRDADSPDVTEYVLEHGLRVLALPEPAKAEAPVLRAQDGRVIRGDEEVPNARPRCAPGCTPRADANGVGGPCRTEGVCPVWREERLAAINYGRPLGYGQRGIRPDLREATTARTQTSWGLGASMGGSWNGREGRKR